ncbi:DUF1592 domain-containing protein [Roseiconus nitratireducens]|uniref:DUF1592 domain-containing protein n=1 Tax=Roseiconus nitratireducens TaxID=2605748 RepID=A0A5M6DI03_9BACT|nr:DUF1592 domain-containing protein [Roseiconus nitratireducens]KAA5545870.1 DUF1592 domain-containing protein [Roseiconus nitratireducens]
MTRYLLLFVVTLLGEALAVSADEVTYERDVLGFLTRYCFDCHGDGANEGNVDIGTFLQRGEFRQDTPFWDKLLRNIRADVMPPADAEQPSKEEVARFANWIKSDVFRIDESNHDPGPALIRRINRNEYQNTIRDLMGYDFQADELFPADDTGYGFDNNAAALNVSQILIEKYLKAAEEIVAATVPMVSRTVKRVRISGKELDHLTLPSTTKGAESEVSEEEPSQDRGRTDRLDFKNAARVGTTFEVAKSGHYKLDLSFWVRGHFFFDPGRTELVIRFDGEEIHRQKFVWEERVEYPFQFDYELEPGDYDFEIQMTPLPDAKDAAPREREAELYIQVDHVTLEGPRAVDDWVPPENYERYFDRSSPPTDPQEREDYASEILGRFAGKAFRRPVDQRTVDGLVAIAADTYSQPAHTFEEGISRAMVAILASPRFLYLTEQVQQPESSNDESASTSGISISAPVDEYTLASRLSYFLWSTMPDEELLAHASEGRLRDNLDTQVERMLRDRRSRHFLSNFVGQWLRSREIENLMLDPRAIADGDKSAEQLAEEQRQHEQRGRRFRGFPGFRRPPFRFNAEIQRAMQQETELCFGYIMEQDRSVLELIDADYTFLNEDLAEHYGIEGVSGDEMRRVELPEDSPRGGVLTQGTLLTVTSNPNRTSPVKRGLYVLENILGTPPSAPPPDVPELEESKDRFDGRTPTLREVLAAHRENAVCMSCHGRMDPLGFALENFNALGVWRDRDGGQPIDASGELLSGETFQDIRGLKRILRETKQAEFYRCLTEKLLIYAMGRGIDVKDTATIDGLVDRLLASEGRFSVLLNGILHSPQFQRRRLPLTDAERLSALGER